MKSTNTAEILIVDHHQQDLAILKSTLNQKGYQTVLTRSAQETLERVQHIKPDLIILEVDLLDMDGFKLFEELQQSKKTATIPVIFLSHRGTVEDILKGLEMGAADYITKPCNQAELLLRIQHQLELFHTRKQLLLYAKKHKHHSLELENLNHEKDKFLGVASHDLKNPLTAIMGITGLIKTDIYTLSNPKLLEYVSVIDQSCELMQKIIDNLLDVNKIESGIMKVEACKFHPEQLFINLIKSHQTRAYHKNIDIHSIIKEAPLEVTSDEALIHQILDNLLSNAIKYSPPNSAIYVELYSDSNHIIFSIKDEGPGFTQDDRKLMFKKFQKLSARPTGDETSTGLGLSIVKELTQLLRGEIIYQENEPKGSIFILKIPRIFPESHSEN